MTLEEKISETSYQVLLYEEKIKLYTDIEEDHQLRDKFKKAYERETQLLKWLEELLSYRKAERGCQFCEYENRDQLERPCSSCCRSYKDNFKAKKEGD